jgi:hypothetical protein
MDSDIAASIEAFKNRRIYSELDPEILRSIDDVNIEQAIFDYALTKLEGQYDREEDIVADLPSGIRALYLTWIVEAEVNNGGFNQYYYNTDGKFAEQAIEAFEYFGATQHAALMREANSAWSEEKKEMAKFKDSGTMEAFSESYEHTKLGPLDERFLELGDDLGRARISRVRETPKQFTGR